MLAYEPQLVGNPGGLSNAFMVSDCCVGRSRDRYALSPFAQTVISADLWSPETEFILPGSGWHSRRRLAGVPERFVRQSVFITPFVGNSSHSPVTRLANEPLQQRRQGTDGELALPRARAEPHQEQRPPSPR